MIKGRYKVTVNGVDVTARFDPRLTEISVTKSAGKSADEMSIKVADPHGSVVMPADRARVLIDLNGIDVFDGYVSSVNWSFDKRSGRSMTIAGSSVDHGGKAKEPVLRHADDKSFGDVVKEWGAKAGIDAKAIGSIASVERSYWIMQRESFQAWGQRMAKELGGTFRIIGDRAFFATRNEGQSASGKPLTSVSASFGNNLISASITPIISRPKYAKVEATYFDPDKAKHITVSDDTGVTGIDTVLRTASSVASDGHAKSKTKSGSKESDREQGSGTVVILGNPSAEPEANISISGCRAGVDGTYRIDSVAHKVDRKGGFTTEVSFKQPKGGAGVDKR